MRAVGMSTESMIGVLSSVAFGLVVIGTISTARASQCTRKKFHPTLPTTALVLIVAVPSILQLVWPGLLNVLERDWHQVSRGQVWRIVSSILVQDGGIAGILFTLVAVVCVSFAAQTYWSPGRIWLTFWLGGVASNLIVGPSLAPVGAGSSMATFVLGCALTSNILMARPRRHVLISAIAVFVGIFVIAILLDYHLPACLLGLAAGTIPPHGASIAPMPGS